MAYLMSYTEKSAFYNEEIKSSRHPFYVSSLLGEVKYSFTLLCLSY